MADPGAALLGMLGTDSDNDQDKAQMGVASLSLISSSDADSVSAESKKQVRSMTTRDSVTDLIAICFSKPALFAK